MQSKVKLINTDEVWNPKKRYKINSTVSYLSINYQNSTGGNSDPTLGVDWFALNKSNDNSVNSGRYLVCRDNIMQFTDEPIKLDTVIGMVEGKFMNAGTFYQGDPDLEASYVEVLEKGVGLFLIDAIGIETSSASFNLNYTAIQLNSGSPFVDFGYEYDTVNVTYTLPAVAPDGVSRSGTTDKICDFKILDANFFSQFYAADPNHSILLFLKEGVGKDSPLITVQVEFPGQPTTAYDSFDASVRFVKTSLVNGYATWQMQSNFFGAYEAIAEFVVKNIDYVKFTNDSMQDATITYKDNTITLLSGSSNVIALTGYLPVDAIGNESISVTSPIAIDVYEVVTQNPLFGSVLNNGVYTVTMPVVIGSDFWIAAN